MTVRFSTGLRDKMYGDDRATVHFTMAAATISFDNASAEIRDSGNGLLTAGALVGDKVYAFGTASNNTEFTVTAALAGALTVTPAPTDEAAGTVFALVAGSGGSLRDIMRNGVLRAYTGTQPATADTAVGTATKLLELTDDGGTFAHGTAANGLNFDESADGVITFPATGEVGKATALATGTIGWFRFCANPTDAGLASTVLPRIDMSSADLESGSPTSVTVDKIYYLNPGNTFTFPYQYGV